MKKGMNWLLILAIISFSLSGCYVTSQGISRIPDGISRIELRARQRAIILQRDNLFLEQDTMLLNQVKRNISSLGVISQRQGYKIILNNRYYLPITFKIVLLNSGYKVKSSETAYNLSSQQFQNIYLLPGTYSVTFWNGGKQIGQARLMTINGQKKFYQGLDCYGFIYMPEY